MEYQSPRKIIHIDMDAFYASVEQRDTPGYRGKPVVVGGAVEGRGGVVATASYEARKFGIHSAMPSKRAAQLCPHAIFVRPRFDVYKEVSNNIRQIFHRYTDLVEPLSLDEAYLDVTEDKLGIGSALDIASKIKQSIKEELDLTASAGVSVNKFVAKIASDMKKPNGLTFIGPSKIEAFMEGLPVEKFYGVGKVTAQKMKDMGLFTGADIKELSEKELTQHFGKNGCFYYLIVRGVDNRKVEPNRETKSLGAEDTFAYDLSELEDMNKELDKIASVVEVRLRRCDFNARTIALKIKYSDFKIITRSLSFAQPIHSKAIATIAKQLLEATNPAGKKIRLLGITLSNFSDVTSSHEKDGREVQLQLFPPG